MRSLEEARSLVYNMFSDARVVHLGLSKHTHNLANLKKALLKLMEEIKANELRIEEFSTQLWGLRRGCNNVRSW